MAAPKLKSNFAVHHKYGAFFTGGKAQLSTSGSHLLCQCGNQVQVLEVETGRIEHTIGQESDDEVTSFVLSPDEQILVVALRGLLLKQWDWRTNTVTRTWRAIHTGPVSCMTFDPTSTLVVTGGSDSTVKVWDVIKQYCTHNLKGHHGVVSVVQFHPDIDKLQLFTAAEDYKIRVWDLRSSTLISALDSHYSVITSLQFTADHAQLYSGGRDNVVTVWDVETLLKKKTIPVYESVESVVLLPEGDGNQALGVKDESVHFLTAGSKGVLRVWSTQASKCVHTHHHGDEEAEKEEDGTHPIVSATYCAKLDAVMVITFDHNIMLHSFKDLSLMKHFVGDNDDVLDIKFMGTNDSHVAVATNSPLVRVFSMDTWDCQVLRGHSDIVMALDISHDRELLVTGSKDNSVRVWIQTASGFACVASGHGHTHAVNAVAFSRLTTKFVVSGGQDCTLKVWSLPEELSGELHHLQSQATEHAHDKDINAVVVAPNDKIVCSGSQDRTAKLWKASDLSLLGVFRGHKRGIWCVQFSPVDQCVATSSADGTVKIWALSDFTCVKTFEGHDSSVLRVIFLTRGMQLLSTGSDGLMKLWTIKTNECIQTFDGHEGKAWALACNKEESVVVTGAGDSTIIVWKDVTEEEILEAREKQEKFILQEQQLSNLIHEKKWLKAIRVAIILDQPFRVLSIMREVLVEGEDGETKLKETLAKLRQDQLDSILRYAVKWNTNSRHCHVAQMVLTTLLKTYTAEQLLAFPNIKEIVEGMLPYTDRHFERMNRLLQQTKFVDYTWQTMKLGTQIRSTDESTASNGEHMEAS